MEKEDLIKELRNKDSDITELEKTLTNKFEENEELREAVESLQKELQDKYFSFASLNEEYKSMIETKNILEIKTQDLEQE